MISFGDTSVGVAKVLEKFNKTILLKTICEWRDIISNPRFMLKIFMQV